MAPLEPDMVRAMKTTRKVSKYGTAIGRIMVREATLLNWQRLSRLVEAEFQEALSILNETAYGAYLQDVENSTDIERGLHRSLGDELQFLEENCHGTPVLEYLECKYDFHNMKVVIKTELFGDSDSLATDRIILEFGKIPFTSFEQSLAKKGSGGLTPFWEETLFKVVNDLGRDSEDPQLVDTIADRLYLERRLELAKEEGSRHLVNFARAEIDASNVRLLYRATSLGKEQEYIEEAFASGGRISSNLLNELAGGTQERVVERLSATKYGRLIAATLSQKDWGRRLTSLDREYDRFLLEKLGETARVVVGPERIVRYFMTREKDVVTLSMVLMAKLHGVGPAEITERLFVDLGVER